MRFLVAVLMCAAVGASARAGEVKVGTPVDAGGRPAVISIFDDATYSNSFNRPPSPYTLRAAIFADGRVVHAEGDAFVEGRIAPEEANRLAVEALRVAAVMPKRDFLYIPPDAGATSITVADPTSPSELAYRLMLWEPGKYQPDDEPRRQFMHAWAGIKGILESTSPTDSKPLKEPVQFAKMPVTTRPVAEQETLREWNEPTGVRVVMNSLAAIDPAKPTTLIIFATPNGNSIEQTFGCTLEPGMDWHYDIQHIAAQTRKLRSVSGDTNIVTAVIEADTRSWPAWRKAHADNGKLIRDLVDKIAKEAIGSQISIMLTGHSGGGSFIFGYINGGETIEDRVERICWMDANYGYDDAEKHGDKLLAWLTGNEKRHLIVFAYNDRAATLNGKPFVSETGGTFYRSKKMIERLKKDVEVTQTTRGDFEEYVALKGQIHFLLHTNPEKKILHTVLVERNGLLEAMTWDTEIHDKWGGEFWGARAYTDFVRPLNSPRTTSARNPATTQAGDSAKAQATTIPARGSGAMGGKRFADTIADLPPKARENAIVQEFVRGNVPPFMRQFCKVTIKDDKHECVIEVSPDYLAIGSDDDFLRMPMTPASGKQVADAFGSVLPTRKMVNAIYEQAAVKLEPRPMDAPRETVRRFAEHNAIIEEQRKGKPLGELVAGNKKDIVISNRLKEKPGRVAIYGWHKPDGKPIQPLYIGHGDFYVDYSHGVRLVKDECVVDGKKMKVADVLKDPALCGLLSDEGVIEKGVAMYAVGQ